MKKNLLFRRSIKDLSLAIGVPFIFSAAIIAAILHFTDPTPPKHIVISTGEGEGEYEQYAKLYQELLHDEGVKLELRTSSGSSQNYQRLKDPNSDVEIGFVQDGFGSPEEAPDLVSLGSLYYEPIWIFYRGHAHWSRLSDLQSKKIAIGKDGGGTQALTLKLLKASGITEVNSKMIHLGWEDSVKAFKNNEIDAAFFLATPRDALIQKLLRDPTLHLMSLDQAEGISRQMPYLHHLILPHGSIDLNANIPSEDVHLTSPTATLLVKDSLHPSLMYLLLKAATQVHGEPGLFEDKNEFPEDKDFQFPMAEEAKSFYKNGLPFWQKMLPFWLASLFDRFLLVALPALALILPLLKLIPKLYQWRIRKRIYQHYGDLKFLEIKSGDAKTPQVLEKHLAELDQIETRVNRMKLPLDFSDHLYSLRGHINFVRQRLKETLPS